MPVMQATTRQALRLAVGYNLSSVREGVMTGGGDATSVIDTSLPGDADDHNGKWIIFTSGANDGRVRQVADDDGAGDLTIRATNTALTNTAQADTYELWDYDYNPTIIHNLLDMSIRAATGKVYDPREDISLFADGRTYRFDIPSDFYIINKIQYRERVPFDQIHEAAATFDESPDANFTQSLDTEVFKQGTSSLKISIVDAAQPGDVITDSFSAIDISNKTHVEMWIRSSIALSAADFVLHLNDATVQADGTDLESLNVPAVATANQWTHVRMPLASPESDTAIVSVGLEYNVDVGACTVWIDDIKAVNQDEALWSDLHRHHWRIDGESRDLVLHKSGRSIAGYRMLKLIGGNIPGLLSGGETSSDESAVVEVPDDYVIARTTGLALSSASETGGQRAEQRRSLAGSWLRESNRAMKAFPFIVSGRTVPAA